MFKTVYQLFNRYEKFQLLGLLLLMLITGLVEMVGVGMIFPFIGIINHPELIFENKYLNFVYEFLLFNSEREFFIFFGIGIILFIILKNSFFALSTFIQQTYLIQKRIRLTNLIVQGYLRSPYEFHLQTNSAILFRNCSMVDNLFSGALQPLFSAVSETIIILCILGLLLITHPQATLGVIFVVLPISWIIYRVIAARLTKLGEKNLYYVGVTSKILLEAWSGIKEILVMNRQNYFSLDWVKNSTKLAILRRDQYFLNQLPRLILEAIIASALLMMIIALLYVGQTSFLLPSIALFATAAFRSMGSMTKIVGALHAISFYKVLDDSICLELQEFDMKLKNTDFVNVEENYNKKLNLISQIELRNINFRYIGADKYAIQDISLEIKKGQSIAFVGASGAGKSTLIDVLLGLLNPTTGGIYVDGTNINDCLEVWRSNIGYIPQSIFLSDNTLRSNIAFGLPENLIKEEAVQQAIQIAQIDSFIKELPKGLDTIIGERGHRLSGGQRQRIAIARALYYSPEILVMDEATSALDGNTEIEINQAIEKLSQEKTLIIIAHRFSTIEKCDCIYFMKGGKINDSGTFVNLMQENPEFQKMAGMQKSQA